MKNSFWSILVLATVLLGACGMHQKKGADKSSASLEDVTWRLIELDGKEIPNEVNGKVPSLSFMSADKRYGAVTGCNGIGGQYEIKKGNQLTLLMGMSTKMYCEGAMEVEDGFGKLFPLVQSYQIEADHLVLKDAGSRTLAKFVLMP